VTTTVSGPAWSSEAMAPEERGQYPLGVEGAIAFHARNLVPFTTTVTAHPRYYALHARAAAAGLPDAVAADELTRRLEVLLAAASLQHARSAPDAHDPGGTLSEPHGFRVIGAALDDGGLNLAVLAETYGGNRAGYSGAYRGVEQAFGLSGGPSAARAPLPTQALAALDPLVALASKEVVALSDLSEPSLCLCALRTSADGEALRQAFFASDDDAVPTDVRAARQISRVSARLCLTALDTKPTDTSVTAALAELCCYGDVAAKLPEDSVACAATAARWRGALLRNESVTAWRWLWWWLTDALDKAPSTAEVLTASFANALVTFAGQDMLFSKAVHGELPTGRASNGTLLPAERELRDAADSAYDTEPLLWLRMLALGCRRLDELDEPALQHFNIGQDDWNPTQTREYLSGLQDKRLSKVAEDLVPRLLRRAQLVARRRQQWTRHGLRMPTRLRPVGDILYVTGPEGTGEAALRQFRLVQMLSALGVLGTSSNKWTPGAHAGVLG